MKHYIGHLQIAFKHVALGTSGRSGFLLLLVAIVFASISSGAANAGEPLRLMSFNIRYGTASDGENAWPKRRELLFSTIRSFDPHLLGLQEALAFQIGEIRAALPGYTLVGVGRDDGRRAGEFSCLLVKPDRLKIRDSGTFWLSDTPEIPGSKTWGNTVVRICTWAQLEDTTGPHTFHAYNTHWDHLSQPSREKSAGLMLARISKREPAGTPVIVMGDFNAGEENRAFRTLVESPLKLRDSFRDRHPHAREVATFGGFSGRTTGEKIDAILVSPEWKVISADIDRTAEGSRYPSDHYPVTAVVRLEN